MTNAELWAAAKAKFGTTNDWREAGHLLPDGTLLDFSGKSDGGLPGRVAIDASAVSSLFEGEEVPAIPDLPPDLYPAIEFMRRGAILVYARYSRLEIASRPSGAQKTAIRAFVKEYSRSWLTVALLDESGRIDRSRRFKDNTHPAMVISFIDDAFMAYSKVRLRPAYGHPSQYQVWMDGFAAFRGDFDACQAFMCELDGIQVIGD